MSKIAIRENLDLASGVQEEIAVEFEANAVAFYAQISGLAKDKIGYPIRELSTNAWDASRGRFDIHLPTDLNPTFRVRDYGPGMSAETMRNVYARLYSSTKRADNNQVGGWGLGSKSPFAYLISENGTGMYQVTSYHENWMRTYTLSLAQDGRPVMRLLFEAPSDAESGLEVSFAVRREDIRRFHDRAKAILWSFEPRPRVFPPIEWAEPKIMAQGEGWTKYDPRTVPFYGPQVRMGPVMYPFDLELIGKHEFLLQADCVVFDVAIGTVSVTLSRESIAYDQRTKDTLTAAVGAYEAAYVGQIQAKVDGAPRFLDACAILQRETSQLPTQKRNFVRDRVQHSGRALLSSLWDDGGARYMRLRSGWTEENFDRFSRESVPADFLTEAQVVIEINPNRSMERMRLAGLVGSKILWVRAKRENLPAVLTTLGNPAYVELDSVKVPARARDKSRPKTMRKRRTLVLGNGTVLAEMRDVDLDQPHVYVTRRPAYYGRRTGLYEVGLSGQQFEASEMYRTFLSPAIRLDILPKDLAILVVNEQDEINKKWVTLKDFLVKRALKKVDLAKDYSLHGKAMYHLGYHLRNKSFGALQTYPNVPETLRQFSVDYAALKEKLSQGSSSESDVAIALLRALGHPVELPRQAGCPIVEIERRWVQLVRTYPLISELEMAVGNPQLTHYFDLLACKAREEARLQAEADEVLDADPTGDEA